MSAASLTLSPADVRLMDRTCDRFEQAWKSGQRPRVEDYLDSDSDTARSAILRQLLLLDWEYRRRHGDDPAKDEYVSRFPDDATLIDEVHRAMLGTRHFGNGATAGPDRYDLAEVIGRGGIGVVYRGRDRELGRELALKALRDEHRDRASARGRLFDEARIGSQLQHPGIVPVYDRGCFSDGRPYFTMKLVEGRTLTDLLRERIDPGSDLSRFLSIFERICQAMAYAHSRGIIHRDLKPANVMIGAYGEVQVMDWGFAKRLECESIIRIPEADQDRASDAGQSQSGTIMGTPAYMPPEQARGDNSGIDARADVFALGALLCQILTGQPPYIGDTALAICRDAADGNLADAQARLRGCGADGALCELASRCLAPNRESRPADAQIVASEVSAYMAASQERLRRAELDRTAAEARADAAAAKARAERRSRQWTVAFAAALLIGGAVAAWQAVVANRAKHDAQLAAVAQAKAKDEADTREAETRAVLEFVQNRILSAARPVGRPGGLGRAVTLRRALEAALPAVDKDFANQPLVEARIRLTLGSTFRFLGDAAIAAEQCRRARTLYRNHLGPDHPATLRSMNNLANCYSDLGRLDDAAKLDEEVFALRKSKLGPDHPTTLSSMNNLADTYAKLGRHAETLKLREQLLALQQARLGMDHVDTLASMTNLAASYFAQGQYDDAFRLGEQTLKIQQLKLGPDHADTLACMNNLAGSYAARGRLTEALQYCEQVLARRRTALGPDHADTLKSIQNLANCYAALGRHAEALPLAEETVAIQKAKLGADHPDTLKSQNNLALHYGDAGRHADALKLKEDTLVLFKAKHGLDHPDTLWCMWGVAASLVKLDRGSDAVGIIDDCVRRAAGQTVEPGLIPDVMDLRLRHFEKRKDPAGCRETAEMWEKLNRKDSESLYTAGRFRAVTARLVRTMSQSPGAAKEADAEADRAMAWLNQAIAAGLKNAARLARETDFGDLRSRSDFSRLTSGRANPP